MTICSHEGCQREATREIDLAYTLGDGDEVKLQTLLCDKHYEWLTANTLRGVSLGTSRYLPVQR